MNVLVIGSGGREHALAWKLKQSSKLDELYIAPGNPGTAGLGNNVALKDDDEIVRFCKEHGIDLVVIGPEVPLVGGLADKLENETIAVFGPSKSAARIEGDKSFSKDLMKKYNIPTAEYQVFSSSEKGAAIKYLKEVKPPYVIKVSGLAAGKGVIIASNLEEAERALSEIFDENIYGESGNRIVIEEFMTGQEASVFAITDGEDYLLLPASQDHKRIYDGDKGRNTGGMGAYAPTPFVTDDILESVKSEIIEPTLKALDSETGGYRGCLYCGLMLTEEGPKVVEFNCRFGDPETQAVLPIIEGDFLTLLHSSAIGKLDKNAVSYNNKAAVCVVATSKGYPGKYEKGFEITGIEESENHGAIVFHAGTDIKDGKLVTSGGRVLGVTSVVEENNLIACKQKAYKALSKIHFEGVYYRKDIADKGIYDKHL